VTDFVAVLASGELPEGSPTPVEVEGQAVCVVRVAEGVFAFDDVCPHRGTPLSLGRLDGTTLTCAGHTWEFDVTTGKLLRIRAPACLAMRAARERDGTIEVAA
jgi:3-phenylpropionate/trans-cinnamate dioxygenase ferredoxin subunit